MNDYFDALERELRDAVPRAARAHRRRGIARLPLFRLSSLWFLIVIGIGFALAPAVGLDDLRTPTVGAPRHAIPATVGRRQTHHRRPPRQPNEFTLLNGLAALRRRAAGPVPELQLLGSKVRAVAPLPTAQLLRFVAASTAVGARALFVVSRRRAAERSSGPAASQPGRLVVTDRRACGGRRHTAAPVRRATPGAVSCTLPAAARSDYTRLVARPAQRQRHISSA